MQNKIEDELISNPPEFPRNAPPYRIHWNWEPTFHCNYRCSYCHNWKKAKDEKPVYTSLREWKKIWDRMFDKYWCCHVRFAGGEPTVYPDFFELLAILLEKHTVDITTNLSFDIDYFMKKVRPGGISVSASYHPEFDDFDNFLNKVFYLHHNGYPSTIAYVAYPANLEKIKDFKSRAENKKIMFKIIPFSGEYKGKCYPRDYSIQEKMLMEGLSADSQNSHLNEINTRWYEWNVEKEKEQITKKGKFCRMGQMYAIIHPDGMVSRCCARDKDGSFLEVLGSIFDPDLKLLDEPMPCPSDNCPCFKSMLVGYEEDKWLPLWEALDHPVYKTEYIKNYLCKKASKENVSSTVA